MPIYYDSKELSCELKDNIYSLKNQISIELKRPIDEIHITDSQGEYLKNEIECESISGDIFIKCIKNRCAHCQAKSAPIIGDCKYCKMKYCGSHRLPEAHKCPNLDTCRIQSFKRNSDLVMSQRCGPVKI